MQTIEINPQSDLASLGQYLKELPDTQSCGLMLKTIMPLCTYQGACPFKGKDTYTYRGTNHALCTREEVLRYKKILGSLKH
ncbi:MAG: hypothetical protein QW594_00885 [Candidatus Woesearchaeota archaeon]